MISNKKHILIGYPIIFVLFVLDQVTKYFAFQITRLLPNNKYELIPEVLNIRYTENTGAAWSILSGKVEFLALMSIIFLVVLVFFSYKFNEKTVFYSISYAFIIGGAFGNLFDRMVFGYVRDFISADIITFTSFPIFNLADAFLVLGVIMFALFVLFIYPKNLKKKK